jgi:hypothetical protein
VTKRRGYRLTEAGRAGRAEANRRRGRRVVCLTTGAEYPSATEAARAIKASVSALVHAIRREGECRGMRFAYVGEPGNPGEGGIRD